LKFYSIQVAHLTLTEIKQVAMEVADAKEVLKDVKGIAEVSMMK